MTAYPAWGGPDGTRRRSPALGPIDVRHRRFRATPLGRRGLAPDDVYRFLVLVADELGAARTEAAVLREENIRIKRALRDWQSGHRSPGAGR